MSTSTKSSPFSPGQFVSYHGITGHYLRQSESSEPYQVLEYSLVATMDGRICKFLTSGVKSSTFVTGEGPETFQLGAFVAMRNLGSGFPPLCGTVERIDEHPNAPFFVKFRKEVKRFSASQLRLASAHEASELIASREAAAAANSNKVPPLSVGNVVEVEGRCAMHPNQFGIVKKVYDNSASVEFQLGRQLIEFTRLVSTAEFSEAALRAMWVARLEPVPPHRAEDAEDMPDLIDDVRPPTFAIGDVVVVNSGDCRPSTCGTVVATDNRAGSITLEFAEYDTRIFAQRNVRPATAEERRTNKVVPLAQRQTGPVESGHAENWPDVEQLAAISVSDDTLIGRCIDAALRSWDGKGPVVIALPDGVSMDSRLNAHQELTDRYASKFSVQWSTEEIVHPDDFHAGSPDSDFPIVKLLLARRADRPHSSKRSRSAE